MRQRKQDQFFRGQGDILRQVSRFRLHRRFFYLHKQRVSAFQGLARLRKRKKAVVVFRQSDEGCVHAFYDALDNAQINLLRFDRFFSEPPEINQLTILNQGDFIFVSAALDQ